METEQSMADGTQRKMSRERILEGARSLLDGGRYGDLTVDALARELHMSKTTLYKHFRGKDGVVETLCSTICDTAETELGAIDPASDDALARFVAAWGGHADRLPAAFILDVGLLPPLCQDRVGRTDRAFDDHVRAAVPDGPDAALLASVIVATTRAAVRSAASGEVDGSRADAVGRAWTMLNEGIG